MTLPKNHAVTMVALPIRAHDTVPITNPAQIESDKRHSNSLVVSEVSRCIKEKLSNMSVLDPTAYAQDQISPSRRRTINVRGTNKIRRQFTTTGSFHGQKAAVTATMIKNAIHSASEK
jgi:hypothetical protein